jgi:hypothetical protein
VYPNKYETNNKVKAGRTVTIPSRSVFRSDSAGVEHMILVASTSELNIRRGKVMGEAFHEVEKADVDSIVQDIRIEPRRKKERLVKELDVIIKEEAEADVSPEERKGKPIILLSTDKETYGLDENMTIAYAADANGYLTLYYINPEGDKIALKETKVRKDKVYRLKAVTETPTGEHFLVGVFSKDKTDKDYAKNVVDSMFEKGSLRKDIRLVEEPEAYKVYQFNIEE